MSLIHFDLRGRDPGKYETAVFLPDAHIPYHDDDTLETVFSFLKDFQPDNIFILGDWIDCYDISKYDKDPERRFRLQKDFDLASNELAEIRRLCPKSRGIFMLGNHEDRLRKWMWRNPDIASLRSLEIRHLLNLEEIGFESYDYGESYSHHGFIVKHGDVVRKHSGWSAKEELERVGISGISGHTHRLASYFKRDQAGAKVWYEAGCLCDLDPEWTHFPNWQQGLAVAYFEPDGNRFFLSLVPIVKHRLLFNGRIYG